MKKLIITAVLCLIMGSQCFAQARVGSNDSMGDFGDLVFAYDPATKKQRPLSDAEVRTRVIDVLTRTLQKKRSIRYVDQNSVIINPEYVYVTIREATGEPFQSLAIDRKRGRTNSEVKLMDMGKKTPEDVDKEIFDSALDRKWQDQFERNTKPADTTNSKSLPAAKKVKSAN